MIAVGIAPLITYFAFELYLLRRQSNVLRISIAPPLQELGEIAKSAHGVRCQLHNRHALSGRLFDLCFGLLWNLSVLYTPVLAWLWDWTDKDDVEFMHNLAFIAVYIWICFASTIPTTLVRNILPKPQGLGEEPTEHGSNGTGFTQIKWAVVIVIAAVPGLYIFLVALLLVLRLDGLQFWFGIIVLAVLPQLLANAAWICIVSPSSKRLHPLPPGPLKVNATAFLAKEDFDADDIYVLEESTNSSDTNSYFQRFPRKRIVLYDNLVRGHTVEESAAMIAHELSHWREGDVIWRSIISIVCLCRVLCFLTNTSWVVTFLGLSLVTLGASNGWGSVAPLTTVSTGTNLVVVWTLVSPVIGVLGAFSNFFTWRMEYTADRFALKLGYTQAIQTALVKITSAKLEPFQADWLYTLWYSSHPSLDARIHSIRRDS